MLVDSCWCKSVSGYARASYFISPLPSSKSGDSYAGFRGVLRASFHVAFKLRLIHWFFGPLASWLTRYRSLRNAPRARLARGPKFGAPSSQLERSLESVVSAAVSNSATGLSSTALADPGPGLCHRVLRHRGCWAILRLCSFIPSTMM